MKEGAGSNRYSQEEKQEAVDSYLRHGKQISYTIRSLGYPSREKPVLNIPAWLWDHSWQYEAPNTGNTITIEGLGESDFSITSNTAHYAIGSIAEAIAGKGKIVSEAIVDDERGYELSYILYSRTDSEYTEETVDIVMEYTPSADEGIEESLHASYKSSRRIVASSGQVTTTGGNGFSFTFRSL